MKRIIEIDDEVVMNCALYSDCQLGEDLAEYVNITELASTIAQSKPYDDSGDCISRSVLDEIRQLYKKYQPNLATEVIEFGNALEKLIDNAQAVPLPNEQITWEQGYEAGLAQGKQERQQGEWIYHDKLNMYFCKDCGLLEPFTKEEIEEGIKLPNFCQQCGADMRKGGTE